MTPSELPFSLPGFEIDEVRERSDQIEICAHSTMTEAMLPSSHGPVAPDERPELGRTFNEGRPLCEIVIEERDDRA